MPAHVGHAEAADVGGRAGDLLAERVLADHRPPVAVVEAYVHAPLVQVLDSSRQLLEARDREAQAAADVRRAWAELERSVGRRLDARSTRGPAATGPVTQPVSLPGVSKDGRGADE